MADTLANRIIKALRARLLTILTANGYETNAGATVRHGRLKLDTPELHLAIHGGSATEKEDRGRNRIDSSLVVEISGSVPVPDSDTGGELTEKVIGDVQKAMEQSTGRALNDDGGGVLTRDITPLGRNKGASIKQTSIDKARNEYFMLTYLVTFIRIYGSPDQRV